MRVRFHNDDNAETVQEFTSVVFRDKGLCLLVNSREGRTTPINVIQLIEIEEGKVPMKAYKQTWKCSKCGCVMSITSVSGMVLQLYNDCPECGNDMEFLSAQSEIKENTDE